MSNLTQDEHYSFFLDIAQFPYSSGKNKTLHFSFILQHNNLKHSNLWTGMPPLKSDENYDFAD